MPWIATSAYSLGADVEGNWGIAGHVFVWGPNLTPVKITLPQHVNAVRPEASRPSFATFNSNAINRLFMVGGWSDNLVLTENLSLARQGLMGPTQELISGAGSGLKVGVAATTGPGPTGSAVCYLRFYDAVNTRHSPLSGASPAVTLANQARAWTNLPVTDPDGSATHIEGWVSMDGYAPRFCWRRDLGATTVTEAVATGALGDAYTEDYVRFPRCRYNVIWHDRQVMAGDDRYPDRLYFSLLNDPENYGGFWLRTRKGERIVGLISLRDQLIILCPTSSYVVNGYTEDDITMDILEPEIGGISHSMVAYADGYAFVASHRGIYLCTGSAFHLVSRDFQDTWRRDYRAHSSTYEGLGWAVYDVDESVVKLYVGPSTLSHDPSLLDPGDEAPAGFTYWVLDTTKLLAENGGNFAQPDLMIDARCIGRGATEVCGAVLRPPGSRQGRLYTGNQSGIVYAENSITRSLDGGDVYGAGGIPIEWVIRTPHYWMAGAGGDPHVGRKIVRSWIYYDPGLDIYNDSELESLTSNVKLYMGGDNAPDRTNPVNMDLVNVPVWTPDMSTWMVWPTELYWEPNVAGKGVTYRFSMTAPPPTSLFHGFGCVHVPGQNDRGLAFIAED
jgi:hypothetical protein